MSPRELAERTKAILTAVGRETRGMHEAAYLLAAFALLSQILALLRDRLLAGTFGASHTLDIYYAAFRLPDLLFATVASLLSLYALLPVLSRLEEQGGTMMAFLRRSLLIFFVAMGVIAAVLYAATPYISPLLFPGIQNPDLILLIRILLLQPILLGASNIVASLTQLRHRFLLYSISPLLYNLGIILGIVLFYPTLGIAGLGWGVVFGACMHLVIQLPFFMSEPSAPAMPMREAFAHVREVLKLSLPRTLALSASQVSLLILTALASYFSPGSIAIFAFAFNLQAVPLAIIGVSYSVAAFPTLSRLHAAGERDEFVRHIMAALRHVIFWALPCTVLIIVLRAQLVRAILGAGEFDWEATRLTAAALALFIVSLGAQSITLLLARAYYAAGKVARPLLFATISVVVAVSVSLTLTAGFHTSHFWRYFLESLLRVADIPGTTILMLSLGYCLGALVQALLGLMYFSRDFNISLKPLRRLTAQSFAAAILGGGASYGVLWYMGGLVDINTTLGILLQGAAGGIAGLAVVVLVLWLLKNEELIEAYASLRPSRVSTPTPALEPTEIQS